MTFLALQSGDWGVITIVLVVFGSVVAGMVKFIQAIRILKRGRPVADPELAFEQEREFQNDEEKS